eukprot:5967735-Alexandrium_andersonii.AAC.1
MLVKERALARSSERLEGVERNRSDLTGTYAFRVHLASHDNGLDIVGAWQRSHRKSIHPSSLHPGRDRATVHAVTHGEMRPKVSRAEQDGKRRLDYRPHHPPKRGTSGRAGRKDGRLLGGERGTHGIEINDEDHDNSREATDHPNSVHMRRPVIGQASWHRVHLPGQLS